MGVLRAVIFWNLAVYMQVLKPAKRVVQGIRRNKKKYIYINLLVGDVYMVSKWQDGSIDKVNVWQLNRP